MSAEPRSVAILALDGVVPLDLGIPVQVFRTRPDTAYRTTVCGVGSEVVTSGGFTLSVSGRLEDLAHFDTVVVPGYFPHDQALPAAVLHALADAHAQGARMVSICVGAFALAQAGILDGRPVTTHWHHTAELAARYPTLRVDPDVLYVDDGNVLTSAGVSAGMDLCLHIVRRDLGNRVANTLARSLVAAPHREGGQAQFIRTPVPPIGDESTAATRKWALQRLDHDLSLTDLARHSHTSTRTLTRRFVHETGLPPLRWLLRARIDLACDLLEDDQVTVEQVAHRAGLGSAANLRLHFRRLTGTTPTAYRALFSNHQARNVPIYDQKT